MRILWLLAMLTVSTAPVYAKDPPPLFVDSIQELPAPLADKAQVVFLEPINKIQGLFPVGIFELNGDQRTLIGVTGALSKSVLYFEPGKHRLMSTNVMAKVHFLDATLEAGKRYYVLVRFVYNEGFQLRPIRPTATSDFNLLGADYQKWQSATRYVEKTPAGDEYFAAPDTVKKIDKQYAKAVIAWNKRTDAERAELTLTPADAAPL